MYPDYQMSSVSNSSMESINANLKRHLPRRRFSFKTSLRSLRDFARAIQDNKNYILLHNKFPPNDRQAFVAGIIRQKEMAKIPEAISSRSPQKEIIEIAGKIGWSSKNAAEICKSDETFKDWQAALISEDNESKYFFNFCPMIHRL